MMFGRFGIHTSDSQTILREHNVATDSHSVRCFILKENMQILCLKYVIIRICEFFLEIFKIYI